MSKTRLCFAITLLVLLNNVVLAANPSRYWVSFGGHVTLSRRTVPTFVNQFSNFAAGSEFRGSFMFDFDLVDHTDSLSLSSGMLRRYFSAVRDFRVEFELPNGTYLYEPPVYGQGAYASRRLNLWGIGDDVNGRWDGLDMRFLNYPVSWERGPVGTSYGYVPAEQYVDGLYPHSSFFILQDYMPPLDMLDSTSALIDLEEVFELSLERAFHIRFTDVNDPNWPGAEQTYAAVFGEITSLRVSLSPIPEPMSIGLLTAALVLIPLRRRWKDRQFVQSRLC